VHDEEAVLVHDVKDVANVSHVLCPRAAEDHDVVEEDKDEGTQEGE
jgi:hypothetical protein